MNEKQWCHVTRTTEDPEQGAQWLTTFEGAGLDGVIAKRLDGPYLPGKREMVKVKHARDADCVAIGYRIHKSGEGVGSILLGLYRDDGELQMVGGAASFTAKDRLKLLADLEPLREGDEVVDGEPSRWNSAADKRWIPVRPEKVAEVAYDQMEGNTVHGQRFRHAVKFVRWRPDRDPKSCTFDQLDVPLNYDLVRRAGVAEMATPAEELDVDGVAVRLTNPDKVYFPKLGSERHQAQAGRVLPGRRAGPMLTALRDRPTHLQRFPDGIDGEEIYQKRVPQKHPDYLETCDGDVPVRPHRRRAQGDAPVGDRRGPRRWAPSRCIPWQVRCPDTEHPDELRIDLDPQPGTGFTEASAIAVDVLKPLLDELGLVGYPKTSGGRGVHVFLRIKTGLGLHRGAPGRHRAGPRGRAARARRGHHVVVEGGARRAALHRLQPERPRPHLRVGVLGAEDPDRDGVDAADVGRAAPTPTPTTTPSPRCRIWWPAAPTRGPTSTPKPSRSSRCWTWSRPTRSAGWATCRIRRTTRRCRASRQRVQPSRDTERKQG